MLDRLAPRPGARQKRKRAARGSGSGLQKTAGRGGKGQGKNSRGNETPNYFEGGQMPLVRRLPKRGFTNIFRTEFAIVNVGQLERFPSGSEITPEVLLAEGVLSNLRDGVKVLGDGALTRNLVVKAHKFSKKALEVIQSAGGRCEVIAR